MSRESFVIVLGVLIIFAPSFGVPDRWREYGLIGAGVLLVLIGYSLRRAMYLRTLEQPDGQRGNDAFSEHNGATPRVITEAGE